MANPHIKSIAQLCYFPYHPFLRQGAAIRRAYKDQKASAKTRGIPFLLTFDEWWQIWRDSGHWHERGGRRGQCCMARYGDHGAYRVGNVKITMREDNRDEQDWAAHAAKFSATMMGHEVRPETRAKISATLKGHKGHFLGCKHSAEARARA
jgi:hypothetical protein